MSIQAGIKYTKLENKTDINTCGGMFMKAKLIISYEVIMFTLAVISVVTIWSTDDSVIMLDRIVWMLFVIDVSTRLLISKDKKAFIKKNPFDFIAVIPFDALFQLARFVRLFRVFRLFVIGKNLGGPIINILRTNGLHKVLSYSVALIILSSIPIHFFETSVDTYQDALWWSIVTATTVGYGDIAPVTLIGRGVAVVLMVIGIGLIGMITGSIATFFITDQTISEDNNTVNYLKGEMERIDKLSPSEIDNVIVLLEKYKQENLAAHKDDNTLVNDSDY